MYLQKPFLERLSVNYSYSINFYTAFLITILYLFATPISGQSKKLTLHSKDSLVQSIFFKKNKEQTFLDTLELHNDIKTFKRSLQEMGYFYPEINLVKENDSNYNIKLTKNKQHTHIVLLFSELTKPSTHKEIKKTIPIYILKKTLQEIASNLESEGATFTQVKLANIRTIDQKLTADVIIDKTHKRSIDKVIIRPYKNFPSRFIRHYFKIAKGKTSYTLKKTENISQQSGLLNFATEIKKPETLFTKDSTHLYLYIKQKKSNKFDGVLGFGNNKEKKGIQFNGHIDIELQNSFNKGEEIAFKWSRNNTDLERLHTKIVSPYVFNSRITSSIQFELKKQDSTFANTKTQFHLETSLRRNQKIGILINQTKSTALREVTNNSIVSFETRSYGITFSDRLHVKKNKLSTELQVEYGDKQTSSGNIPQTRGTVVLNLTIPTKSIRSYFIKNVTKVLNSKKQNTNELYIAGGSNSLRGFNENSIVSSSFNYTNNEMRFKTNETSFLYTFLDVGIFTNTLEESINTLYGVGAGYSYKTRNGQLNLSYGLGSDSKEKIDFSKGIFHIKTSVDF